MFSENLAVILLSLAAFIIKFELFIFLFNNKKKNIVLYFINCSSSFNICYDRIDSVIALSSVLGMIPWDPLQMGKTSFLLICE